MTTHTCPKCSQTHDPQKCTGHNSRGLPCGNRPIRGGTVCSTHGGSAPQVQSAAERRLQERQAVLAVEAFGLPREIDPHSALLEELHRTAGAVQWLGAVVAGLDQGVVTDSAYVGLWQDERDRLAKVAKICVDVGIEERRVRLAEQAGAQLAAVVRAVLGRLGLSDEQWVLAGSVVPEEFRRLSGEVVAGEVVT
jgi:2-hydroxychromene-2-carboxylate isomerase